MRAARRRNPTPALPNPTLPVHTGRCVGAGPDSRLPARAGALLLALALAQLAGAAQEGAAAGAPAPSAWKGRIPVDPATYLEKLQEDFPTDEEEYQISPFIEARPRVAALACTFMYVT